MANFTDNQGLVWSLNITTKDVRRVRDNVIGARGKPVDLLEIAENGDFSAISGSAQVMLNVIFWLCYDQLVERFDVNEWNETHKKEYALNPVKQTNLQKAADWFGERIGGAELTQIAAAWEAALINFIPNPRVKQAVQKVARREQEYQKQLVLQAEKLALAGVEKKAGTLSSSTPVNSD